MKYSEFRGCWLAHLTLIPGIPGSNFGRETNYPDIFVLLFLRPSWEIP
jgi:hypothetical protein